MAKAPPPKGIGDNALAVSRFTTTTLGTGPRRLTVAWQLAEPRWSLPPRTASPARHPLPATVKWILNSAAHKARNGTSRTSRGSLSFPIGTSTTGGKLKKLDPSNYRRAA